MPVIKYIVILLLLLVFTPNVDSQTVAAFERAGDKAMELKEYYAASEYYQDALELNNDKVGIRYKFADACRFSNAFTKAEKAYARVRSSNKRPEFPQLNLWLGLVKMQQGKYRSAEKDLKRFLNENKSVDNVFTRKADQAIIGCNLSQEWIQDSLVVSITRMNNSINTPYSEFAASKIGDTLFYSSLRFEQKDLPKGKQTKLSRLMRSVDGAKGRQMRGRLNVEGEHSANGSFDTHSGKFYYTKCFGPNNVDIICAVYSTSRSGNGWASPVKLDDNINLKDYTSTQPNIGYHFKTREKGLYFVSNRPGGLGGMDIWFAVQNGDGTFKNPENVGPELNSEGDEISPYWDDTDNILYFSSDWWPGLGGFDNFYVSGDSDFLPVNLGYPINSSYNDIYYFSTPDGESIFSSNRPGALSLTDDDACCNDIYSFIWTEKPYLPTVEVPPPLVDLPVEEAPDTVKTEETIEKPITVPIPERSVYTELANLLPIPLYFHNDEPDSNTVSKTTSINYTDTYNFYYSLKQEYITRYSRGDQILADNVDQFFEFEVRRGYEELLVFAELVSEALASGLKIEVAIKGFTSPRAPTEYNFYLANRRINSIKNFFNNYRSGFLRPFIESGLLNFVETPFGETTAPAGISDIYSDRRNSIYSVEASRERRVEILKIDLRD